MEANNMAAMRDTLELCIKRMTAAICDSSHGDDALYIVGCMMHCITNIRLTNRH